MALRSLTQRPFSPSSFLRRSQNKVSSIIDGRGRTQATAPGRRPPGQRRSHSSVKNRVVRSTTSAPPPRPRTRQTSWLGLSSRTFCGANAAQLRLAVASYCAPPGARLDSFLVAPRAPLPHRRRRRCAAVATTTTTTATASPPSPHHQHRHHRRYRRPGHRRRNRSPHTHTPPFNPPSQRSTPLTPSKSRSLSLSLSRSRSVSRQLAERGRPLLRLARTRATQWAQ
jgi:hypothetical protein